MALVYVAMFKIPRDHTLPTVYLAYLGMSYIKTAHSLPSRLTDGECRLLELSTAYRPLIKSRSIHGRQLFLSKPAAQQTKIHGYCIGLCSVLRPRQHSIGYMKDGFYR